MERLTIDEVKNKLEVLKNWVGDISLTRQDMQHCIDETIHALAEFQRYRDLAEQGRLVELPCKVGDTVWDNVFGKWEPFTITGYSFGVADSYIDDPVTDDEIVFYYSNSIMSISGSFAMSEIGNQIFLTKEEAKLKELEGGAE